jgi:hypothetical protein
VALLKYNKNQYLARSLKAKLILESKLSRQLSKLFKEYAHTVHDSYRAFGLPYYSPSLEPALKDILFLHYNKVGSFFGEFHKNYKKKQKKTGSKIDTIVKNKLELYYDELSTRRAHQIIYTTHTELSSYVRKLTTLTNKEGLNLSRNEIAKVLNDLLIKRADSRARSISLTETNSAAEKAKSVEIEAMIEEADDDDLEEMLGGDVDPDLLETVLALGGAAALAEGLITPTKTWNAIEDNVTREAHLEADGQSVPVDSNFEVDGEELEYPGDDGGSPENTINCRCEVTYDV